MPNRYSLSTVGLGAYTLYNRHRRDLRDLYRLYRRYSGTTKSVRKSPGVPSNTSAAMPSYSRRRASSRRRTYRRRVSRRRYKPRMYRKYRRSYGRSYKKRFKLYRRTAPEPKRLMKCCRTEPLQQTGPTIFTAPVDRSVPIQVASRSQNWISSLYGIFYFKPITYPDGLDAPDSDLDRRQSNQIYLSSFKIHRQFYYRTPVDDADETQRINVIKVHWGLFQPKDDDSADRLSNPANDGGIYNGMFRVHGGQLQNQNQNRANFENPGGTGEGSLQYWQSTKHCEQFNPEGSVRWITHKTFTLYPKLKTGSSDYTARHKIEKFYKVKKWISFNSNTAGLPKVPIYEFWWYQTDAPWDHPTDPTAQVPHLDTWCCNKTYWADKN